MRLELGREGFQEKAPLFGCGERGPTDDTRFGIGTNTNREEVPALIYGEVRIVVV